jgi:hypothetical protein
MAGEKAALAHVVIGAGGHGGAEPQVLLLPACRAARTGARPQQGGRGGTCPHTHIDLAL